MDEDLKNFEIVFFQKMRRCLEILKARNKDKRTQSSDLRLAIRRRDVMQRLLLREGQEMKEAQIEHCVNVILNYSEQLQEKEKIIGLLEAKLEAFSKQHEEQADIKDSFTKDEGLISELEHQISLKDEQILTLKQQIARQQIEQPLSLDLGSPVNPSNAVFSGEPRALIAEIRRQKGIDVVTTPEMQQILRTLYVTLEQAISKLADDIYSSNTRFALGNLSLFIPR
jgi:hypothetical protein